MTIVEFILLVLFLANLFFSIYYAKMIQDNHNRLANAFRSVSNQLGFDVKLNDGGLMKITPIEGNRIAYNNDVVIERQLSAKRFAALMNHLGLHLEREFIPAKPAVEGFVLKKNK